MFHLAAYSQSLTTGVNQDIDAIADAVFNRRNANILPGVDVDIIAMYALGDTLTRLRLNSPRVQAIEPPYFLPLEDDALPKEDPNVIDLLDRPFRAAQSEEIDLQVTSAAGGGEQDRVLIWLQRGREPAPAGEVFTLRSTSTTAAVAETWTNVTVTEDWQLPAGQYAVVGGAYAATNAVGFRFLFDGQLYRPGGIGQATEGVRSWDKQLNGGLGLWGRFSTNVLPQIEVLNASTDAVHTFLLQVVRMG